MASGKSVYRKILADHPITEYENARKYAERV